MTNGVVARARRVLADQGGAAAVEFAVVAPFLAAVLAGVVQYAGMTMAFERMHDAVSSGAVYVMRGGSSATTIHDLTVSAWSTPPGDAAVTVTQACSCAGTVGTCSTLCADASYPQSFTTITATATYSGLWGSKAMSTTQTVRTQ